MRKAFIFLTLVVALAFAAGLLRAQNTAQKPAKGRPIENPMEPFVPPLVVEPERPAQAPAATKSPKPAAGPAAEALAAWNSIGRKLITMAEDFPENKYDFKPKPEVRTFAEQLLHVAGTNYVLLSAVKGSQIGPGTEDPPRSNYKTKADVVAFLKKSVEDGAALIKERGNVGMPKAVKSPYGNRMVSANFVFMEGAEHSGEHYGQLVVYYRLNGIVPPASRPQQ